MSKGTKIQPESLPIKKLINDDMPEWVMGTLEQARVPDQELMESHGAGRSSRSKDNGPLELGALNKESEGLHRVP